MGAGPAGIDAPKPCAIMRSHATPPPRLGSGTVAGPVRGGMAARSLFMAALAPDRELLFGLLAL
jgi:hypothetical protein